MTALNQTSQFVAAERRQFRLISAIAFVVFLTITAFARLLPRRLRPWSPSGDRHLSFVAEARALTNTVVPFAFL